MTRSDLVRRPLKPLAALAVITGLIAGFVALSAGSMMGGALLQGDLRQDTLWLTFNILPFALAYVFVLGILRERSSPPASMTMYGGAVLLIAIQLMIPAIP